MSDANTCETFDAKQDDKDLGYYVIFTGGGKEADVERAIMKYLPRDHMYGCFHPVRIMHRKRNGKSYEVYQPLIPGYVFIITNNITEVYAMLRRIPRLTLLLGQIKDERSDIPSEIIPLSEEDISWLLQLVAYTPDRYGPIYAGISHVGFDENDRVEILDGPLASMQGLVKKINLHKRYAEVEVDFLGQKNTVHLGIDLLARE